MGIGGIVGGWGVKIFLCVSYSHEWHMHPHNFLGPGVTVSFFPSQFFPRGKNGPAHSFPGEKTDRSVFSPGERFD